METKTADLADAREFAEAVHARFPDKMLAYNLSPSFNWDTTGMTDEEMSAFPGELGKLGFDVLEGVTAIVPVMLYDAKLATKFADEMLSEGIYVIGFSYPVVPQGQARIRVQISAAHETAHLDRAVRAFETVGKRLKVI